MQDRRAVLRGHLADVEHALALARREANATTRTLNLPRGEVDDLRNEVSAAEAERRLAAQELEALTRLRARISLEHERTLKALVAGGVFAATAWDICPRCLQDLKIEHPALHCVLCGQLEPPTMPPDELEAEQDRLRRQIGETDLLIVRARHAVDAAEDLQLRTAS